MCPFAVNSGSEFAYLSTWFQTIMIDCLFHMIISIPSVQPTMPFMLCSKHIVFCVTITWCEYSIPDHPQWRFHRIRSRDHLIHDHFFYGHIYYNKSVDPIIQSYVSIVWCLDGKLIVSYVNQKDFWAVAHDVYMLEVRLRPTFDRVVSCVTIHQIDRVLAIFRPLIVWYRHTTITQPMLPM